jgi:6-pyruvoyltetrahydropterin/6-carboxytetrahydropterin synthase
LILARRYTFSASHRLHSQQLDDAANRGVYGKCNNPFGHGHNYTLEVSVRGAVDQKTGLLLPTGSMDQLISEKITSGLAHRNLNDEVGYFQTHVPTTEELTNFVSARLREHWPAHWNAVLHRVRIWETKNNQFEEVF